MRPRITTIALTIALLAAAADPDADEVSALPGWPGALPSRQWSGYLSVGTHKHLHYWLVEAERQPETAPVVLWLNGGPGCSSLDGFIYEHGPFRTDPSDPHKLIRFPQTWATLANMLYLEAPAGVGFSYSDDPSDYDTDDDKTAADNLAALNAFFAKFPRLATRKFFIAGESYAGVYVPTLAEAILAAMVTGSYTGAPLKGMAVGNGCSGTEVGVCGGERWKYSTQYFLGTAFVAPELKADIRDVCDFSAKGPSEACTAKIAEMHQAIGHVNLYNVYGDCISGHTDSPSTQKVPYDQSELRTPAAPPGSLPPGSQLGGPDACIDSIAGSVYFNQPAVIAAAHVHKQPIPWSTCGNQIRYKSTRTNLPRDTYPGLVSKLERVLIYNGDWDSCVPNTDGAAWTESMGYRVVDAWHPWLYKNGTQVAGYAINYEHNFTFLTVKGGRHEVPETAPKQALEMLRRLVGGVAF